MKLSEIETAVEGLQGVGPSTAKLFSKMGIFTVADLLSTYPRDYEDRTKKIPLSEYKTAKVHTICKVTGYEWFGYGRMKTLKIAVTDGTAQAWLVAFNRPFLQKSLPEGSLVSVTGQFIEKYGQLQSSAFDAVKIADTGDINDWQNKTAPDSAVLPIYPLTEGLSQKVFRKTVALALKQYGMGIDDEIPQEIISERKLLSKKQALVYVHVPATISQAREARATLIYEELYLFERKMALRALEHRGTLPADSEKIQLQNATSSLTKEEFAASLSPKQKQLFERLEFNLTRDQMQSIFEMNAEIDRSQNENNSMENSAWNLQRNPFSMQRLLQGDVGSGKTLAAFFVCLRVVDYGGQCAVLAPTELLARQHADNAAKRLGPLGVKVAFLTANIKSAGRENLLKALKTGDIDIVVGTHALFSRNTNYKKLQLAVIDEQHRFGVAQRESIVAKGRVSEGKYTHTPDVLMMSATPIPQTLALTVFGDLDISTIRTMPEGRKSIKTYLSVIGHEANVYEAVRKELQAGRQAYFVYPRISEESQENQDKSLKSAQEMFIFLSNKVYPEYKCALVHGKTEETEQNALLDSFRDGTTNILVATTVVEVGVDVPNATCMVIEHADRFGLAELHQLRGRVGRGSAQSYCFLIYGKNITQTGIERLKALHETTDGFKIAEEDLKLRGPGEVSGTVQSGYLTLNIADLARDKEVLKTARLDAISFLQKQQKI